VAHKTKADTAADFDAVIIGAGVSGRSQLYKLRELGLNVRVFETGAGVAGTWVLEPVSRRSFRFRELHFGYSFSQELLEEWNWAESFASQPESERYLNYVADKFDLRRDILFNRRVTAAAHYEEETRGQTALNPLLSQGPVRALTEGTHRVTSQVASAGWVEPCRTKGARDG